MQSANLSCARTRHPCESLYVVRFLPGADMYPSQVGTGERRVSQGGKRMTANQQQQPLDLETGDDMRRLSRRSILRRSVLGITGVGLVSLLAACGGDEEEEEEEGVVEGEEEEEGVVEEEEGVIEEEGAVEEEEVVEEEEEGD